MMSNSVRLALSPLHHLIPKLIGDNIIATIILCLESSKRFFESTDTSQMMIIIATRCGTKKIKSLKFVIDRILDQLRFEQMVSSSISSTTITCTIQIQHDWTIDQTDASRNDSLFVFDQIQTAFVSL